MKRRNKIFVIGFLIGALMIGGGTVWTYWEWSHLQLVQTEDVMKQLDYKTMDKTLQLNPEADTYQMNSVNVLREIHTDPELKDGEVVVKAFYNRAFRGLDFNVEDGHTIHMESAYEGYGLQDVIRLSKPVGEFLKKDQLVIDYQPLVVDLYMNAKTRHKCTWLEENHTEPATEKSDIVSSQVLLYDGERVTQRIYRDGKIEYRYPDGRKEVLSAGEALELADDLAEEMDEDTDSV